MADNSEGGTKSSRRVNLTLSFHHFELPPIRDALVIGKRAPVGANSIGRAFQEMAPGEFHLVRVDHPSIEALLVRESDLRKLPGNELIGRIIHYAEAIMDQADALHVNIDIEVIVREEGIEWP